jgi:hypothetical protein
LWAPVEVEAGALASVAEEADLVRVLVLGGDEDSDETSAEVALAETVAEADEVLVPESVVETAAEVESVA